MKKTVTIISIICVVIIAAGVLVLTGVIDVKGLISKISGKNATVQSENTVSSQDTSENVTAPESRTSAVIRISYMDTSVLLDKNGVVVGTTETEPENVMKLSGVNITKMVIGEAVEVDDRDAFDYGLLITNKLAAVGIPDKGEVFISSDGSATLYLKNIKILLGKNNDLLDKLEALRKFYNKVIELEGTLDMEELDRNNMGYTFKVNDDGSGEAFESEIMEETETDEGSEEDPEGGYDPEEEPEVYEDEEDGE